MQDGHGALPPTGLAELFRLRWPAFGFRRGSVTVSMGKSGRAKTVYSAEACMAEAKARFGTAESGPRGSCAPIQHKKSGKVTLQTRSSA